MNQTSSTYSPTAPNATYRGAVFAVLFNGKEKDYESGLHYYGARYYDCELLTGWLSVDPMADKYPSLSPYNYCAWNSVKLVDPDGRDWYDVDANGNIKRNEEQSNEAAYKGYDYLHSTATGETSDRMDLGTIKNVDDSRSLHDCKGQCVTFGENSTSNDQMTAFKFCAENTDVEFSYMVFEGNQAYLTTSHDSFYDDNKSSDNYGSEVAKANARYLVAHYHNHLANGEWGMGSSDEDYDFRDAILKERSMGAPNPTFGIYKCKGDPNTRKIIDYSKKKTKNE